MSKLIVIASILLTSIMVAMGYVVTFVTSMFAIALKLPGPYADAPIAWVWFGFHIVLLFGVSFWFCRWLARRIEKRNYVGDTFR